MLFSTVGFVAIGLVLACCLAPALNALALGEDAGRALGVGSELVRGLAVVAVTVLAGAATAAAGPIMFIGLGVPYLARAAFGPDQRLVLPGTALAAPVLLLATWWPGWWCSPARCRSGWSPPSWVGRPSC